MKKFNDSLTEKIKQFPVLIKLSNRLHEFDVPVRFRTMAIDQFSLVFIMMGVGLPLSLMVIYITLTDDKSQSQATNFWISIYASLLWSILFNKDVLCAQSIGKRIYNLQVSKRGTTIPASELQCIIRNVTAFIWPVEIVVLLVTKNRRLGDFIARTEVTAFSQPADTLYSWKRAITCIVAAAPGCWLLLTLASGGY